MKKRPACLPQTLINVEDVKASSRWYCKVLGCESGHGGPNYEMLMLDGVMIMQLHAWDLEHHHHRFMGKRHLKNRGNGAVLWFQLDDFDGAMKRIKTMRAEILEPPHVNPNANHRECWLRDRDGYVVVIASDYDDV